LTATAVRFIISEINVIRGGKMKFFASLVIILTALTMVFAQADKQAKYIGTGKCKICHKLAKYGNQHDVWEKSAHAKAYATLACEKSLKIAKEMNIENPQKSEQCLSCHVTAFEAADSLKEASYTMEEGVGCEQCHGPGSKYKTMAIMKDREKSIANGLILPDEKTCLECHNEKSPTYKPFKYEEMFKKIEHPGPKEEETEKS
jgi:hypothetical protein